MRIKDLFFGIILLFIGFVSKAQEEEYSGNLALDYDLIDAEWHTLANSLNNYEGFKEYCANHEYQKQVKETLHNIHHMDSLILEKLNDFTYPMDKKVRENTLKEITKFETKYKAKDFFHTLKRECKERHDI